MSKELTPEEILTRDTYDKYAQSYIQAWSTAENKSSGKPDRLSKFKELLPTGRILDIGAGGGRAADLLVNNGYDYVGTDVSSGMLEQARNNNPGIRFEQVSIYDLNFDELFDGFWCSAVLLHIPKNRLNEALATIHKNMKQDAYGFISIKEGNGEIMEEDGRFNAYWSDGDFSKHLNNNNYRIIERNRSSTGDIRWLEYIVRAEKSESDD